MPPADSARKDTNTKTAQMVRLISEIGPDIPEISRKLGQYKESVRYRYKTKLLEKGFAVQAIVDHEKLGLRRVIVVADFADEFIPHVRAIALAMNQLCYVVLYAKTIPDGRFIIHASVPEDYVGSFANLVSNLKQKGILRDFELSNFSWFRNISMRPECYDFNTGRWDFDWSATAEMGREAAGYLPSHRAKYDYADLLILKELHIDATRSMTEIASKLKINYKNLMWHYQTHVLGRRLAKGYRINWMGTRYDTKMEKALHRRHSFVFLNVLVRDLSQVDRMSLMSELNKLPFLWSEAGGGSDYYAQLALPLDFVTEGLQFVQKTLEPLRDRARFYIEDTSDALAFTFSYQLYDQETKKWLFDPAGVLAGFGTLMMKIRGGTG
jgi:DNA-binding Lrp family transcriptional regulator